MVASIVFGRGGSKGFPNKNITMMFGKKVMEYPLIACYNSNKIDKMYVSSDSEQIIEIAKKYDTGVIKRPDYLCTDKALLQDAIIHAYEHIKTENAKLKYLVLTLCNSPNIRTETIDEGIKMLEEDDTLDSIITVANYDMFSPERARKPYGNTLQPYIPFEKFNEEVTCDRKSHDKTFFSDQGMCIVRVSVFDTIEENLPPFQWMGKNIGFIEQIPGGCDIDYPWQVAVLEWWLKQHNLDKLEGK